MHKAVYSNADDLAPLGRTWSSARGIRRGVYGLLCGDSEEPSGWGWVGGGDGVIPVEAPCPV